MLLVPGLALVVSLAAPTTALPSASLVVKGRPLVAQKRVEDAFGEAAKVRLKDGAWSQKLDIAPSTTLVPLEFRANDQDKAPWTLLIDVQPGHHYRLTPDPCCTLAIHDDDSDLHPERKATPACAAPKDGACPAGLVSVPSWIAQDGRCGDAHACVGPIEVQFDVAAEALGRGPLSVRVESDEDVFTLTSAGATAWQAWPWGRETSPARVEVRRGNQVLWQRAVQLRHEHRYRIIVPADPTQLRIVRER